MSNLVVRMREVDFTEYHKYVEENRYVEVENVTIELKPIEVTRLEPTSDEMTDTSTTVWSFPKRGSWATHKGDYRGNWAPQIPRALLEKYTKAGDLVLDPMMGSGTTLIEARLLGRNAIGVDINYNAVILTLHRLYYLEKAIEKSSRSLLSYFENNRQNRYPDVEIKVYHGDARNLDLIEDESVDMVATHPPYFHIIRYSNNNLRDDISNTRKLEEYLENMKRVASELYRVLKPDGHCAILIGDTRIRKHYVPISSAVMKIFLDAGFILREEIIKIQHNMKGTRERWKRRNDNDFHLIYHEKLLIFRKPANQRELTKFKYSTARVLSFPS